MNDVASVITMSGTRVSTMIKPFSAPASVTSSKTIKAATKE